MKIHFKFFYGNIDSNNNLVSGSLIVLHSLVWTSIKGCVKNLKNNIINNGIYLLLNIVKFYSES